MVKTVQLLVTCLVDGFFPEVGRAVVTVLERLALTVEFPLRQTCCGQPAFNAGHRGRARAMAAHTVRLLDATEGPIVIPSGSCAAMLVHHAPELLASDPDLAKAAGRVADRVRELTQFLVDDLGVTDVGATGSGIITLHHSCHGLRNLGLKSQAETLLDAVDGIGRCELEDAEECCGFGGLFAIEMPEISAAIANTKLDNVEASGADTLVGSDVSCLMHLAGGLHRRGSRIRVRHIAEVLAGEEQP
jgi:L-lactate dehydrogenase complex protein LldE